MGNVFIYPGAGARNVVSIEGAERTVLTSSGPIIEKLPSTVIVFIDGVYVAESEQEAAKLRNHRFYGTLYQEVQSLDEARAAQPSAAYASLDQEEEALRGRLGAIAKQRELQDARLRAQGGFSADTDGTAASATGGLVPLDKDHARATPDAEAPIAGSGPTGALVTPLDAHAGEMVAGVPPEQQPIPDLPVAPQPAPTGSASSTADAAAAATAGESGATPNVYPGVTRAGEAAETLQTVYDVDVETLKGSNGQLNKERIREVAEAIGVSFPDL